MEEISIQTHVELQNAFKRFGDEYLYRGQTKNYTDATGEISIPSSFNRHGCIPPLMFKWTHYAKAIIRAFGGEDYHNISLELSQALLQHYGWRSFFVDLTKSPQVASWFAANSYKEHKTINMCEDFREDPVWLVHKEASYENSELEGHIYVISPKILEEAGISVHDLSVNTEVPWKLRANEQSACLAATKNGFLPSSSIVAHLEVSNSILTEYCKNNGLVSVNDLFPSSKEDFVLATLMNIPWERITTVDTVPAYKRGLELPEYKDVFSKHLSPSIALYSLFWIADNRNNFALFKNIPFYKISEGAYYASSNELFDLKEVTKLLKTRKSFVIELNGLISIPESKVNYEYEKGIMVELITDDTALISGLILEHPGKEVTGAGMIQGWYYRINGNLWTKEHHVGECGCNNHLRHELQFSLLRIFEDGLCNRNFRKINELTYKHKDLCPVVNINSIVA